MVVHIGNDAAGPGGIASVIRQHLRRGDSGTTTEATAVTTYRVGQSTALGLVTFARAVSSLTRLRLGGARIAHVHLSQRGSILREGVLIFYARVLRFRGVVVTLHGSSMHETTGWLRWLLLRELGTAHLVHVLSHGHQTLLDAWGVTSTIVPNDVEVPDRVPAMASRRKRVVFLGETSERKGIEVLLAAWRRLSQVEPDWSLSIAGEAHPSGDRVMSDLPDRAEYLGVLPRHDVQELLEDSRILVLPSRAETFPMAVCEAMARGCAVVSTPVGAVPEILRAELSVQLLDEVTVGALERHLRRLISDRDSLEALGSGNRLRIQEFAEPRVSAQWHSLYRELVGGSVGRECR